VAVHAAFWQFPHSCHAAVWNRRWHCQALFSFEQLVRVITTDALCLWQHIKGRLEEIQNMLGALPLLVVDRKSLSDVVILHPSSACYPHMSVSLQEATIRAGVPVDAFGRNPVMNQFEDNYEAGCISK